MFGPPTGDTPADRLTQKTYSGQARTAIARTDLPRGAPNLTPAMLSTFPIFAELSPSELARLAPHCMMRCVPRNTQVIRAGEPSRCTYLVLSGTLNVIVSSEEGKEAILLQLGPGELFGEMGAIDNGAESETVLAETACKLVALARTEFKRCLREHPSVTHFVMRTLIARQEEANRLITSLCLDNVSTRVIRLLRQRDSCRGTEPGIEGKLNRQKIAKMVGASREMVSRVLTDLKARGRVETRNGRIVMIGD
jgi:CRP/FNR family transcriptional regulator, cyclic AMP receptor protein